MTTRRWLSALAALLFTLWSGVASAGEADLGAPAHSPRVHLIDPTARPRIIYRGRALSYASFAMLGSGAALAPFGALSSYDFHGDPFDKWKYDRVFDQRRAAALPMLITGLTLVGAHLPTLMAGVLVEGHGLHKVTGLTVVPGWVGFGLIFTGATLIPVGIAAPPVLIVGSVVGLAGYVCVLTQFGLNVRASRRDLAPAVHDELYHSRRAPSFGAAPLLLQGGGGATFVMSW